MGQNYTFAAQTAKAAPWHHNVLKLFKLTYERLGLRSNGCLMNFYDGEGGHFCDPKRARRPREAISAILKGEGSPGKPFLRSLKGKEAQGSHFCDL